MRLRLLAFLCLLMFFVLDRSTVLASPFETPDRATISGPEIVGERTITEPALLATLQFRELDDTVVRERETTTEPASGTPYLLTRYLTKDDGTLFVVDRLRYYPGQNGAPGRFFYQAVGYTGSPYNEKWLVATTNEDATFAKLVAQLGIQPVALPRTGGMADTQDWALVLAALGGVASGSALLRRYRSVKAR
jgi:hypothetical protein